MGHGGASELTLATSLALASAFSVALAVALRAAVLRSFLSGTLHAVCNPGVRGRMVRPGSASELKEGAPVFGGCFAFTPERLQLLQTGRQLTVRLFHLSHGLIDIPNDHVDDHHVKQEDLARHLCRSKTGVASAG